MKKILFYIMCPVILLAIIRYMTVFLKSEVIRPESIGMIEVTSSADSVNVKGNIILESSKAYKSYSFRTEAHDMYITIYGVLVSPFHRYGVFNIDIDGEFPNIENIYLEGKGETLLIWSKHRQQQ